MSRGRQVELLSTGIKYKWLMLNKNNDFECTLVWEDLKFLNASNGINKASYNFSCVLFFFLFISSDWPWENLQISSLYSKYPLRIIVLLIAKWLKEKAWRNILSLAYGHGWGRMEWACKRLTNLLACNLSTKTINSPNTNFIWINFYIVGLHQTQEWQGLTKEKMLVWHELL